MASVLSFRLLLLMVLAGIAAGASCSSEKFTSNRAFAVCSDLPQLSSSLHWTYDAAAESLSLAFVAQTAAGGWAAWAINPSGGGMAGAQALVAFQQTDGSMGVKTYNISGYGPIQESPIAYETSDLAAEYSGGTTRLFAKVKLPAGKTVIKQVWQVGPSVTGGVPDKHDFKSANLASTGTLDLAKGESVASSSGDPLTKKKNVHGILNAVSWGILLPTGAIFARYLKTFKSADPAWFYLHVTCQIIGYSVGVGGWATGLSLGSKSKGVEYTNHRNIGIALFALGTLQVFALFLRPNKDHKLRFYWNMYHHSVGYTVIILGVINVFKGLDILSADQKWTTIYIILIAILGAVALFLEVITWIIYLRSKKSDSSTKPYGGSSTNGVQRPLSA